MTEKDEKKIKCKCPYCDHEIEVEELPFCGACNIQIVYCKKCGMPIPVNESTCPTCGETL
jgi:hypothetical protein